MNKVLLGAVACAAAFLLSGDEVMAITLEERGPYGRPYEIISEEDEIAWEVYDGERELLAMLVQAEAGNQSLEGKQRVVDVVLNRVQSSDFPDTITEVIYQKGQFKVVENGALDKAGWTVTDEDFEAVRLETECAEDDRLDTESLYFSRGKSEYATNWYKCGDHWFGSKKSE